MRRSDKPLSCVYTDKITDKCDTNFKLENDEKPRELFFSFLGNSKKFVEFRAISVGISQGWSKV